MNSSDFCILIPSRKGSKGLKNKNLLTIKKKSLVEISILFSKKIIKNDTIFVSSDSKKVKDICNKNSVNFIKRPIKLSGDRISDFQVIEHSLSVIKNNYKYLIYLQPTSPLRDELELKKAMMIMIKKKPHAIYSISSMDKKFHPLKIFKKNSKNFINLNDNNGKKIIARQQLKDYYIRNGVFYIFAIKELKKNKHIYPKKIFGFETVNKSVNIDSYQDYLDAKKIIK